ncbi:MAG: Molybdopterin biosynthesis protein moeA [Fibrobacterota bacterium]
MTNSFLSGGPGRDGAMSVEEADEMLSCFQIPVYFESVDLAKAGGRLLIGGVVADRPVPAFDRICMDGYAFAWDSFQAGRREFQVQGAARAGHPRGTLTDPQGCMEAMTGAVLPAGCDTVIQVEKTERIDDGRVRFLADQFAKGANVHETGRDRKAGELVIKTPALAGPGEIAALASLGVVRPKVACLPQVVLVSSGDELVEPGRVPMSHQVRQSNVWGIAASLELAGLGRPEIRHIPDDEKKLRQVLSRLVKENDAVILSGGVSMGKWDLIPGILESVGVEKLFHGLAQQPGMPLWMGMSPKGGLVAGLPGNPLSALTCFVRHVRPILERSAGFQARAFQVVLQEDVKSAPKKTRFVPVKLERQGVSQYAKVVPVTGSGDWAGVVGSDGFVEILPGAESVVAGSVVGFHPW